jgi:hypothetical protein
LGGELPALKAGKNCNNIENRTVSTLGYGLGIFEGFNFRTQSAIEQKVTAGEMVNGYHDLEGEAEFWPAGEKWFKSYPAPNLKGNRP